jgi:hypothetical protein
VVVTNIEEETEAYVDCTDLSIHTPRVSDDDILLVTSNCQGAGEGCSELNVLNRETGILTQLTYFGKDSVIRSPHIDAGRIAFRRESKVFPLIQEAFAAVKRPASQGWALSSACDADAAVNLALLLPPLAIAPLHRLRRIRRRPNPLP